MKKQEIIETKDAKEQEIVETCLEYAKSLIRQHRNDKIIDQAVLMDKKLRSETHKQKEAVNDLRNEIRD